MKSILPTVLISLLIGFLIWAYFEYCYLPSKTVTIKQRAGYNLVLLRLPTNHDPNVFGAPYWEARHKLAELIPCPACRIDAVSHEKFFHDWVNIKKEKEVVYKDNFNRWIKELSKAKYKIA